MIGKLTGIIDQIESDTLILDVGGVGYVLNVSPRTMARIGQPGERVSVLVHTHVREDIIQLYGFADRAEREWFNVLTTVQGVGNKVALAILGVCPPERLPLIIASQDKAALTQADGVGPKLASRILTELKDKAGDIALGPAAQTSLQSTPSPQKKKAKGHKPNAESDASSDDHIHEDRLEEAAEEVIEDFNHEAVIADAVGALLALGYTRSDSYAAVSRVAANHKGGAMDVQHLVKMGLKELAA